ncbi:MAG: hypothetical protein P4L64_14965 [Caulobacteraceae bacterium]|nr:hypothetical protein [Caulobacteraceae bacterium]
MLKALLSRRIDQFERTWTYDASYMRELLAASPWTFLKFSLVTGMVPRKDAPAAALAAAGIVGTLAEDCGPCVQISVDMAAAGGLTPEVLRAILAGDVQAMGPDAALGYGFARAVLDRRLDEADAMRDQVLRRWGHRGLVALTLALTTARIYPTVKYGLGHGRACSRVTVAGEAAPLRKPEILAA